MTEVVTSFAAVSQLNLLAQRQQGLGVSAPTQQPAPTVDSNALHSVLAAADKTENQAFSGDATTRNPDSGANSGPSRPRVEIKQFDVGLSPSEVVGTPDVLQRFDANGDGRVDLLESDKAALARQKVFTFAGLAAAPGGAGRAIVAPSSPPPPPPKQLSEADAPALARETGAAIVAAFGTLDPSGLPKKFVEAAAQGPGAKKYYDGADAAAGVPSGTADAPKKYYGQGVEVVAGPAANNSGQPVKYADRAPVREQAVSEEGTGEVKYYDRVPQAEAGDGGGSATTGEKYHDKAQEVISAYAQRQGGEAPVEAPAVTVLTA